MDRRCAVSTFNETCPFRGQAATSPFRRRRACPFHWQAVRPCCRVHYAHHYSRVTKEAAAAYQYCMDYGHHGARRLLRRNRISYFYNVFPPFCSWAHMSGLSILVRAPLELLEGGHTTLQGRFTQTLKLTSSYKLSSSHTLYNTQWSRVLRSGGLNHSKPLCVLVFTSNPPSRQEKRLGPSSS
jgi:hypothetical protein